MKMKPHVVIDFRFVSFLCETRNEEVDFNTLSMRNATQQEVESRERKTQRMSISTQFFPAPQELPFNPFSEALPNEHN